MCFHHSFILNAANSDVSLDVPTFTKPSFLPMSYIPYGAAFSFPKSCTLTLLGFFLGRYSFPWFLYWPIISFFFVSTDIAGRPFAMYCLALSLIYRNCSLRSGWSPPSKRFELD